METLSITGRANTLQESLNKSIPPSSRKRIQTAYLRDLYMSLLACSLGDIKENPYFNDKKKQGLRKLQSMRSKLSRLTMTDTSVLTDVKERHRLPHWNRLMLVWVTLCSVHVLLAQLSPPDDRADDDGAIECSELYLLNPSQPLLQILSYRMSSLRLALEMLCARVELLTQVPEIVHYYVNLIEVRCAQFVAGSDVIEADYDVPEWRNSDRAVASNEFVAESMWRVLAVKQQLNSYRVLSKKQFYAKSSGGQAEIVPLGDSRSTVSPVLLQTVYEFVRRLADTMNTDDHRRGLKKRLNKYDVFPGDCDVHTQLYNKHSVERATPSQIIGRERSPTAVEYVRIDKYKRTPCQWIDALFARRALNGPGNHTRGGGAYSEAAHEQATFMHVIDMAFRTRTKVAWIQWFVVSQRASGAQFVVNVLKGLRSGLPFIVQRLGRYACCVPRIPADRNRAVIEQYINCEAMSPEQQYNFAVVLYECHDIIEAFAMWAVWIYYAFDGIVHSKCRIAPLLRKILGIEDGEQGEDATATQQLLEADL